MCNRCGVEKPKTKKYYHWRNKKAKTFSRTCLLCQQQVNDNDRMNKWYLRAYKLTTLNLVPQELLPTLPIKDSEYHKNVERLDSNPSFFRHLCSGKNY